MMVVCFVGDDDDRRGTQVHKEDLVDLLVVATIVFYH